MVLMSGTSGNALSSLFAIDQWIGTLNASIAGSARTGYKNSQVTFGGGTTRLERPVVNGALGIQYAEQALNVGSTNIDFSQGQVVASTQYSHMAISGSQNTFFMVCDKVNMTSAGPPPVYSPATDAKYYYTRDGEFHPDANENLVNANGLFLVSMNGGTRETINIKGDPDPQRTVAQMIDRFNLGATTGKRAALAYLTDLSDLKYSKYGGTVLESTSGAAPPTLTTAIPGTVTSKVGLTGFALEASNVQLPSTTVELSLAQKIYNALTKVIQVDQSKLESILNLIR